MKKWNCDFCGKETTVYDDYKPHFCCDGGMCGCYGLPVNPVTCDECDKKFIGAGRGEIKMPQKGDMYD